MKSTLTWPTTKSLLPWSWATCSKLMKRSGSWKSCKKSSRKGTQICTKLRASLDKVKTVFTVASSVRPQPSRWTTKAPKASSSRRTWLRPGMIRCSTEWAAGTCVWWPITSGWWILKRWARTWTLSKSARNNWYGTKGKRCVSTSHKCRNPLNFQRWGLHREPWQGVLKITTLTFKSRTGLPSRTPNEIRVTPLGSTGGSQEETWFQANLLRRWRFYLRLPKVGILTQAAVLHNRNLIFKAKVCNRLWHLCTHRQSRCNLICRTDRCPSLTKK